MAVGDTGGADCREQSAARARHRAARAPAVTNAGLYFAPRPSRGPESRVSRHQNAGPWCGHSESSRQGLLPAQSKSGPGVITTPTILPTDRVRPAAVIALHQFAWLTRASKWQCQDVSDHQTARTLASSESHATDAPAGFQENRCQSRPSEHLGMMRCGAACRYRRLPWLPSRRLPASGSVFFINATGSE